LPQIRQSFSLPPSTFNLVLNQPSTFHLPPVFIFTSTCFLWFLFFDLPFSLKPSTFHLPPLKSIPPSRHSGDLLAGIQFKFAPNPPALQPSTFNLLPVFLFTFNLLPPEFFPFPSRKIFSTN